MRGAVIAAMALAAAACSTEPAANEAADANMAAPAEDTSAEPEVPANTLPPADNSAAPATLVIPATIQGRWGLVPADCTSTRGDAKGLLVISDKQLTFYESRGTLTRVVEGDDSRIVGDFDMSGEGMTWQRRMTLDAQDEGKTLVRRETGGEDAMPGALKYSRCEG